MSKSLSTLIAEDAEEVAEADALYEAATAVPPSPTFDIRPGAVMKLKREHCGYSSTTLFLCSFVEGITVGAKSHYGQETLGPTLHWPLDEDWFEVVEYTSDQSSNRP